MFTVASIYWDWRNLWGDVEIVFPVWDSPLNHTGLYESTRIFKFLFAECDFILDIPLGFLKILDGFPFFVRPPDVFHRIPKVETHVLGDLDALHPGRVGRVVLRVIHFVERDAHGYRSSMGWHLSHLAQKGTPCKVSDGW